MAQAKNGLIYNGTGTGLNEWDGEKWNMYPTPQKSRIRSIAIGYDEKIYIGTTNDVGYYAADDSGILTYQSLLNDWTFEEKQFGETFSVAANEHGAMFLSKKHLLFWNGTELIKVDNAAVGYHRIFAIDDKFYYKSVSDEYLYVIEFIPELYLHKTEIKLETKADIRKLLKNSNGNLTMVTGKYGIYEYKNKTLNKPFPAEKYLKEVHVYNATQAKDGYYYVTTLYDGLYILNENFELEKNYRKEHGFGTNTLLSVIEDFQGNIWLSGEPNIIKLIPAHRYSHYTTESGSNMSEGLTLIRGKLTVFGDSIHQLEILEDNEKPAYFKHIVPQRKNTWGAVEFKNHLIYAGAGGVFSFKYDDEGETTNFNNIVETQFAKSLVIDVETDTLFATSAEGLFRIIYINSQWDVSKVTGLDDDIQYIAIEAGILWIGTSTQELYRVENAQHPDKENIITKFSQGDGIGANNVIPFNISSKILIGTNDGLMGYEANRVPQLQFIPEMPELFKTKGMDVYRLYEDEISNLWFRIGNRTGYLYKDKQLNWKINENLFKPFPDSGYKGFIKTARNILWFSMADGQIFRVNIDHLKNIPQQGKLNIRKITNLDTDELIYGGSGNPKLPQLDQQTNSIRINYALTNNSIANVTKNNSSQYRYRLIGSANEEFSKWSNESHKDFTLLQGGNYEFEVQSKDAWGRINVKKIKYTVLPPWYLSVVAFIIYIVLVIILIVVVAWLTQKWRTAQLEQTNKQLEKQVEERTVEVQAKAKQLEQQQILKDRFFTNVSHEFRTPLTLTIAPLEAFISDHPKMQQSSLHPIQTALKNSKKMLSLVAQVLDINRLEAGQFPLRIAQYNLSDLINTITKRFQPWAEQNKQKLLVTNIQEPTLTYFDQDQIEKCISNLISNAIKYSGDETTIVVSIIKDKSDFTGIGVTDNGIGIRKEFENNVFDRFSQDKNSEQKTEPGTGIGLALVKELMQLHHGSVELNKSKNEGCQFVLWLRNGKSHYDDSLLHEPIEILSGKEPNNKDIINIDISSPEIKNSHSADDITTLLVVDDNQELREFISSRLSSYYRILQANNGHEGLAMARSMLPDLIISDVMMPILDGLKMTKELKSNPLTKTIPIILLTAKSSKRETVTGLQSGADDYLSKPFDTSELITRVNGLINNRKLIRNSIKSQLTQKLTQLDKSSSFIEKLHSIVLSQLSNPKFNVDSLSKAMAMGRHSLNSKCKDELNKTTSQYITETRMHYALSLLKLDTHSISEIAYGTGFDSLAYFSRIFKKHYGKTPTEMRMS